MKIPWLVTKLILRRRRRRRTYGTKRLCRCAADKKDGNNNLFDWLCRKIIQFYIRKPAFAGVLFRFLSSIIMAISSKYAWILLLRLRCVSCCKTFCQNELLSFMLCNYITAYRRFPRLNIPPSIRDEVLLSLCLYLKQIYPCGETPREKLYPTFEDICHKLYKETK